MFGYVSIYEPELKMKDFRRYKAFYCGLCRTLKEKYGSIGQLTLTYDMTFVIILLTSLYESEVTDQMRRCKAHPVKKQAMLKSKFTDYAADMNLILSYYHLKDDWEDEGKLSGFAGTCVLRRKVGKVRKKYPRQCRAIQRELKAIAACEKKNTTNIDLVAGCFGRLMGEILVYQEDHWAETLREMGFFLGKFIYLMDAVEDLEKDFKQGLYNPLKEIRKREDYEEYARELLCMMAAESSAAFERLPCLQDVDILRNVLYAGVWNRYRKMQDTAKE